LYSARALVSLGLQDWPSALRDLEEATRHEPPGRPTAVIGPTRRAELRCELLYRVGRYEQALDACDAALKSAPDSAEVHRWRVAALLGLQRYDEVIRSCDGYLAKGGKPSAVLYEIRGLARARRKDLAGAIEDYTQSLALRPGQSTVHAHRGWAYLVSGAARLAWHDFDEAIGLDPANGEAYNGRGNARVLLGEYRIAVTDAEKAMTQGEPTPRILYNAARIYAQAAEHVVAEAPRRGLSSSRLSSGYKGRAQALLRQALERTPAGEQRATLWRDVIQPDPALRTIFRYSNVAVHEAQPIR
jgi:tetratricopeptide (TPR) repeat protein